MKNKYLTLLIALLTLILVFGQPGYIDAQNGNVIDSETRDRLTEQYGLEQPEISHSSGIDIGISDPVPFFITISKIAVNPYAYMVQKLIHHWVY
ncbi:MULTISPECIES: hypothetical protein [unclassified Paenibacillus]|uniref:hypothetical protein n=1 Tax=unclassified Paenibacillus TaxID=185978 RepID=UPI0036C421D1